jgi:KEOPS complex subunit Cgi121
LLRFVEEFQKYVLITGLRANRIDVPEDLLMIVNREKSSNVEIQIFDAESIATWEHLHFAFLNALIAFKNKTNVSRSIAMETMLYASAKRQIRRATEILGVKSGSTEIAIVMFGERAGDLESSLSKIMRKFNAERDEAVLELSDAKVARIQRIFDISNKELDTVTNGRGMKRAMIDLIIERMALLPTYR